MMLGKSSYTVRFGLAYKIYSMDNPDPFQSTAALSEVVH